MWIYGDRERFEEIRKKIKREKCIEDDEIERRRRKMMIISTNGMSMKTPCAACKLLRRRCGEDCPFSPYFSPNQPHRFAAVHKVFGASNVSKMLSEVPESRRADAANSLVYEANVRLRDPIYGCLGAISCLQQQLHSLQAELNAARSQIITYKCMESANNSIMSASATRGGFVSQELVSVAAPPPPPTLLPPPPAPPPSLVGSSSSSSFSSLCAPPPREVSYVTIQSNNLPYF